MTNGVKFMLKALGIDDAEIQGDLFGSNLISYYHDWTDSILYNLEWVELTSEDPEELAKAHRRYDEEMAALRIEVLADLAGERESRWTSDVEEAIKSIT